MSFGRYPYGGVAYAGSDVANIPSDDLVPTLAVEVAFTTGALEEPVWVDIAGDVRSWSTRRGRERELERFVAGTATIVLGNLDRQYDSVNTAGPWYGMLKPGRRIRIRETFNGVTHHVFTGYVDRWQLDYPAVGKDATATVTATDAFKLFARTDMGVSVYNNVVLADAPELYWRLDEQKQGDQDSALTAGNSGTAGTAANGTYVGPPVTLGAEPLVVKDPGGSMMITSDEVSAGTGAMGVVVAGTDFAVAPAADASFVLEAWCIPQVLPGSNGTLFTLYGSAGTVETHVYYTLSNTFVVNTFPTGSSPTVTSSAYGTHKRYHVVARVVPGDAVRLWINGELHDDGETAVGTLVPDGDLLVGHFAGAPSLNWVGPISHVAVWRGAAAQAVDQAWVDNHYEAGTAPWQGDLPGERAHRVLDFMGWPEDLRLIDEGNEPFQSASF